LAGDGRPRFAHSGRRKAPKRPKLRMGEGQQYPEPPQARGRSTPTQEAARKNCSTRVPRDQEGAHQVLRRSRRGESARGAELAAGSPRCREHRWRNFRRKFEAAPRSSATRPGAPRERLDDAKAPFFLAVRVLLCLLFAVVGAKAAEEAGGAPPHAANRASQGDFKWNKLCDSARRDRVGLWQIAAASIGRGRKPSVRRSLMHTNAKAAADAHAAGCESRLENLQKKLRDSARCRKGSRLPKLTRLRAGPQERCAENRAADKAESKHGTLPRAWS